MLDGATGDGRPRRRALETIVAGAADGAASVTVPAPGGGERFTWARHEAGWFEGAPLRLELVAAGPDGGRGPGLGPGTGWAPGAGRLVAGRAALWALADAVVVVAPGADGGTADVLEAFAGWASGRSDPPPCTVFAEGAPVGELAAAEAFVERGLPAPLVIATATDGAGVRYGLAMVVRGAIERLRRLDARGAPRTLPSDADGLAALLDAPEATIGGGPATTIGGGPGGAMRRSGHRRPGRVPVPAPPWAAAPGGGASGGGR
ncbi:MAG: hypothetical protein AB7O92_08730 [Acidimicrobiia bacterium]